MVPLQSWLAGLHRKRLVWLAIAAVALIAELLAVYLFQEVLGIMPCEKCISIRLSMWVIVLAGLIGFLNPQVLLLRLLGYLLMIWAIYQGIVWSYELVTLFASAGEVISSCSMRPISFPFNLPLDVWFPDHFMVMSLCGDDTWSLLGINMAHMSLLLYLAYVVLLLVMFCAELRLFKPART